MHASTIALIAGLVAMASAQAPNTFGTASVGDGSNGNDNDNGSNTNEQNDTNGCHGVLQNSKSCCVGGTLILSICDGWPICNSPATTTGGVVGCITNIPVSDPNYSALQASALASATGSGNSPKETGSSGSDSSVATTKGSASDSAPSQTKGGSAHATDAPKSTMVTSPAGNNGGAAATSSSAAPASSKTGDAGKNIAGMGIAAAAALAAAAF